MLDKEKRFPKKGENVFEKVVHAEAAGIYPSNQMDEGIVPRSNPESRAGIDAEGESSTKKNKRA